MLDAERKSIIRETEDCLMINNVLRRWTAKPAARVRTMISVLDLCILDMNGVEL